MGDYPIKAFILVITAVLLLPAGFAVADSLTHSATEGVTYETNSEVSVTLGDDRDDVDASPFADDETFADNDLRLSGSDADVTVGDQAYSGDPVTITDVDVTGSLTVERVDLDREFTVEDGDANTMQVQDYAVDNNETDLAYNSDAGLTVSLDGLEQVNIAAVDVGTGEPLDTSDASGDGSATFELPSGTREIRLEPTPSELEVRDEQTQELLTEIDDMTIEFYESGENPDNIESVEVVNGTADMEGLDVTTSFVAVAEAEGYANRRIFIDSLFETQQIYLLDMSADSVTAEYELEDFSGEFPQAQTVMVIERNIDGEWTPIQGDFFGSTGKFEANLLRDTRHRMRVVNVQTGDERVIGAFTPQQNAVETVTILPDGSITVDQGFDRIHAQPAIGSIAAAEDAEFGVDIQEGETPIESWDIEITLHSNGDETTLATRSGSGASLETFALDLTDADGGTVIATVDYETPTESGTVRLSRSVREHFAGADGLIGGLVTIGDGLGVDGDEPSSASMMASLLISLLITAGVARVSTSADVMGLTALLSVTGFAILGWVPFSLLFAASVGFGAVIVIRRGI